jgi:hypothetical protein
VTPIAIEFLRARSAEKLRVRSEDS